MVKHKHIFSLEPMDKSSCFCGRLYKDYLAWLRAHPRTSATARWAKTFYGSVAFDYPGPYDGTCELPEANKALHDAEIHVEDTLTKAGIKFQHEYSWPDGSLVKRISVDLSTHDVEQKLRALFPCQDREDGVIFLKLYPTAGHAVLKDSYDRKSRIFRDMTVSEIMDDE